MNCILSDGYTRAYGEGFSVGGKVVVLRMGSQTLVRTAAGVLGFESGL